MRPQQQNRRMRGRNNNNNNNRKGPNPLTRNYESNGPDVKIRGSAQQIAEKYATLARDAMSSGDRVMAENYLQHAEHYNRIIAAAQAQMPIQHQQQNRDDFDDDLDEDRDDFEPNGNVTGMGEGPQPVINHGAGPQPVIEGTPAEVALNSDNGRDNQGSRQHRERRHGGYGQNGQRNDFNRNENYNRRDDQQSVRRDDQQPEAAPVSAEGASQPDLGPAALAAQAEQAEAGADFAARRSRRPRRGRGRPDQNEAVGDAGGAEDAGDTNGAASGNDAELVPVES